MEKKTVELEKLKKFYAVQPGDVKWLPEGGDILNYIGQKMVFIDFTKDESEQWVSNVKECFVMSIDDYNPDSMTYRIKYKLTEDNTEHEERIIPEGFNYEFTQGDKKDKMNRFVPYSLHFKLMETELLYARLKTLFDSRETLEFEELLKLNGEKDQVKHLLYSRNIGAVIECDDEDRTLMYFRITKLKFYHHLNQPSQLVIYDDTRNLSFSVTVLKDEADYDLKYKGEDIGMLKIIDLQG